MIHSGYGRPSYWGGSASVPRVQQCRGLALLWFDGQPEQPDFTHAWFPAAAFDEVRHAGPLAAGRCGTGAVLIRAAGPLEAAAGGPAAGCELRLRGRRGWWLVRTGRARDLTDFVAAHATMQPAPGDDARAKVTMHDAEYGPVVFYPDGSVAAEGRVLRPQDWTVAGTRGTIA